MIPILAYNLLLPPLKHRGPTPITLTTSIFEESTSASHLYSQWKPISTGYSSPTRVLRTRSASQQEVNGNSNLVFGIRLRVGLTTQSPTWQTLKTQQGMTLQGCCRHRRRTSYHYGKTRTFRKLWLSAISIWGTHRDCEILTRALLQTYQ